MQKKDDKVGNKTGYKKKGKRKKKRARKKYRNRFAKEKRNLAYAHARKTKKPLNCIQLVEI